MNLHPVLAVIIGILAMLGFIFLAGLIVMALGDYASLLWILVYMAAGGVIGWILLSRH